MDSNLQLEKLKTFFRIPPKIKRKKIKKVKETKPQYLFRIKKELITRRFVRYGSNRVKNNSVPEIA